ncbi:MAG: hypothetical protein RLZZ126_1238 [Pseudomonadota bacterium]|jgi:hypothetical protein
MTHSVQSALRRFWPHLLAAGASLLVYAAYLQPDFMVMLANEIWACF